MNLKKRKTYTFTDETSFHYTLSKPLNNMVMTKDACTVIGITRSGIILFWNTSSGRLESTLKRKYGQNYSYYDNYDYRKRYEILLSADGSFVLVFDALLQEIARIDVSTKKIESVIKTKIFVDHDSYANNFIEAIAMSPKNDCFLVAFAEKIVLTNVRKYAIVEKLIWEGNSINVLAYNSKGVYFVAGSLEGNIILYSQQPLKSLWNIKNAHNGEVSALLFMENTEKIISAGDDGQVKVWDFHTGKYLNKLYVSEQRVRALVLSEDEKYIVITLEHSVVTLFMESLEVFSVIDMPCQSKNDIIFTSLVQENIAIHTTSSGLQMNDIKSAKLLKNFTKSVYSNQTLTDVRLGCGQGDFLRRPPLDISLNSRYLVSALSTQKIALWDMREVELVGTFGDGEKLISAVGITSDNKYLFSAGFKYVNEYITEPSIEMYEVESSLMVYSFEIDEKNVSVICLHATPDGSYLIALLSGGKVMKWDLDSLELLESKGISCHEYDIYAPTMSLDGSLLMYALDRSNSWSMKITSIEIVDIATGRRVENIECMMTSSNFLTIEISNDNRYVTLYSGNLELFCWDRVYKVFMSEFKTYHLTDKKYNDRIVRSVIAPNRNYRVNIYEDEKRGLSIWNLDKEELYRLFVAENENALIVDMEENDAMVDGEDEILVQKVKELKIGEYQQINFGGMDDVSNPK